MMKKMRWNQWVEIRWEQLVIFSIVAAVTSCSAGHGGQVQNSGSAGHSSNTARNQADARLADRDETTNWSAAEEDNLVCMAYQDDEVDPLQRWIRAYPIERGGAIIVFVGSSAEQMEVEASLEMAAIVGYEDQTCGTAVVVWVPGLECQGEENVLATRIEEGTTMTHSETTCFTVDEVNFRIREECERGTIPADHCP